VARRLVPQQGRAVQSHGNSYAQSWADVQFQRMPNINLLPHPERDVPLEELIDGVENGILIDGNGSFSIDQQRYNAQFGGQVVLARSATAAVGGMLKDVAYQIRTPEFWNSMDLLGGPSTYGVGGSFGDGKGQPAQSNAVSHACPPTRHRVITSSTPDGASDMARTSLAKRRAQLAERVLAFSQADEARVNIRAARRATRASP
jgi:TldD protein